MENPLCKSSNKICEYIRKWYSVSHWSGSSVVSVSIIINGAKQGIEIIKQCSNHIYPITTLPLSINITVCFHTKIQSNSMWLHLIKCGTWNWWFAVHYRNAVSLVWSSQRHSRTRVTEAVRRAAVSTADVWEWRFVESCPPIRTGEQVEERAQWWTAAKSVLIKWTSKTNVTCSWNRNDIQSSFYLMKVPVRQLTFDRREGSFELLCAMVHSGKFNWFKTLNWVEHIYSSGTGVILWFLFELILSDDQWRVMDFREPVVVSSDDSFNSLIIH